MPELRRIAWCITDLDAGGAERALVQIVTRLPALGWTPRVDCLSGPGELVAPLKQAGIEVNCLDARPAQFLKAVASLARIWRAWQPELVQSFMFHANIVSRFAALRAGIDTVVSGLRVAERDARLRMRLDRWTQRFVTHNVAVSRGVADFAIQEVGLRPERVSVIPNGVDCERFALAAPSDLTRFGIPTGSRVITFIGRLHPQKAPDLLLTAVMPLLAERRDLHLLLVGDGPLRERVESTVANSGLADRIHLAGRQADVAGLLRASTVCVIPSRWEGLPNVALEAMAAGCPVVCSDVEGSRELIEPGRTGWVFPSESAVELRSCLIACLDQPDTRAAVSLAAQHIVQEYFTWDLSAKRYAELYQRLCPCKGNC